MGAGDVVEQHAGVADESGESVVDDHSVGERRGSDAGAEDHDVLAGRDRTGGVVGGIGHGADYRFGNRAHDEGDRDGDGRAGVRRSDDDASGVGAGGKTGWRHRNGERGRRVPAGRADGQPLAGGAIELHLGGERHAVAAGHLQDSAPAAPSGRWRRRTKAKWAWRRASPEPPHSGLRERRWGCRPRRWR